MQNKSIALPGKSTNGYSIKSIAPSVIKIINLVDARRFVGALCGMLSGQFRTPEVDGVAA
jgi:hypothetical protein